MARRQKSSAQIAAQVAVESIANEGVDSFDPETVAAVLAFGIEQGVADLYLDLIR